MVYKNFIIEALISTLCHKSRGLLWGFLVCFFSHKLFPQLTCFLSASPNVCSRHVFCFVSLCLMCTASVNNKFYHAGIVWISHYPLKDQGSCQCIVYNWNCGNVDIVNYSKMEVTVQVNYNFSRCDVSFRVFLFISRRVGLCVDQSAVTF